VIEDKRPRARDKSLPDLEGAEDAIVCTPPMLKMVQNAGLPCFLVERAIHATGLKERQPATTACCLRSLRADYFCDQPLDERNLQRRNWQSLVRAVTECKGMKQMTVVTSTVDLAMFAAFFGLDNLEAGDDPDVVVFRFGELPVRERLAILKRFYGTLVVKLTNIGSNKVTRYVAVMAAGVSNEISYRFSTSTFTHKAQTRRFKSNLEKEGAGVLTPRCADPKNAKAYHFSLVQYVWVKCHNPPDQPAAVDKICDFDQGAGIDYHFGLNGTELE